MKIRADHGTFRTPYQKNRRAILNTQDICALCGRPVDKSLKSPDPMSATVDHIIPIAKGGHPSDLSNLQLAHRICNTIKKDKLDTQRKTNEDTRIFYQSRDWKSF